MANTLNIPNTAFTDERNFVTREWLQWLLNPNVQSIKPASPITPSSGGTGTNDAPANNNILVGNGSVYVPTPILPDSAFPGLSGDVSAPSGSTVTTLAIVNTGPGTFGGGSNVSQFSVNGKGLITSSTNVPITSAIGSFSVAGAFGCNGQPVQASAAAGSAVTTTAATNVGPYGYATAAQADRIVSLLNTIRSALIANGIMV